MFQLRRPRGIWHHQSMLTGTCHCGAVEVRVEEVRVEEVRAEDIPAEATVCNCSICRRYAATWLHCTEATVTIIAEPDAIDTYCWGDEMINFHRCAKCGCITHYTCTEKAGIDRVSVNLNNMPPEQTSGIRRRRFDGAHTWQFLDD